MSAPDGARRLFHGHADGVEGLFIDRYGPGATLIVHDGTPAQALNPRELARAVLEHAGPLGVASVYHKPFARDRSRATSGADPVLSDPVPLAGPALSEALIVREGESRFEVRLYDGFSTGLFLDQSRSRATLPGLLPPGGRVLNTFAYTCSFSVACAQAGARTTSVDVSARYLEWGRRNFAHSGIDPAGHVFLRRGTMEFLERAGRQRDRWDLIILDPPTYSAGSRTAGAAPWNAQSDYARLVGLATRVLAPSGLVYASTNCRALCRPGALERQITEGLGRRPEWLRPPAPPEDFPGEADRATWALFTLGRG